MTDGPQDRDRRPGGDGEGDAEEPREDGAGAARGDTGDARGSWDTWDEVEFDERFIRGAEVSEPAARTRMLRKRWGNKPPEPQPWRADEPPAGWLFSKARRRSRRKRRRGDGG